MSDRWVRSMRDRENDGESRYETRLDSPGSGDEDMAPSEEGAPDCVGRLLGVRCFLSRHPWAPSEHRDDRLYSLFHDHAWEPGKDEHAKCLYHTAPWFDDPRPAEHPSPHEGCQCGFYAYYSYWHAWEMLPRQGISRIYAAVSGWGNIEEYERGFRSEYMHIEALVGPLLSTVRRRRARKMIERFAGIYGVPVVWSPRQSIAGWTSLLVACACSFQTVSLGNSVNRGALQYRGYVGGRCKPSLLRKAP